MWWGACTPPQPTTGNKDETGTTKQQGIGRNSHEPKTEQKGRDQMTTRLLLAIALCAGLAVACDDGPTTPTAPTPADGNAETARADGGARAIGGMNAINYTSRQSAPTGTQPARYNGRTPNPDTHQNGTWPEDDTPGRGWFPRANRTYWLTATPEPVDVGTWTSAQSCSGSNCYTHEDDLWTQKNSCTESGGNKCWVVTRSSTDGKVTVKFTQSGHQTWRGQGNAPVWQGMYYPNGYQTTLTGENCAGGGVNTPVECKFTIPAAACEADEIWYGYRIPGRCRLATFRLKTETGGGQTLYHHTACVRTRATFDGKTFTSDYGTCR